MSSSSPYTFDRVVRITLGTGLLVGIIWLLHHLREVLIPFAVAVLVAYLLNPLVELLQKKIRNRAAAVFSSLALVTALFIGLGFLVVPMVTSEVKHTAALLRDLVGNSELAQKAGEKLPPNILEAARDLLKKKQVRDVIGSPDTISMGKAVAEKALPGIWGFLAGTANVLIGLLGLSIIFLYVIFLLFDIHLIKTRWKELLPAAYRTPIVDFTRDFNGAMRRYFRGQAAVASIVGVLFAIGFTIIGLPLGILLGLFIGLLNMVPYLQIVGLIPAAGFAAVRALETGGGLWLHIGLVGAVFAVVQLIQDAVLVPRIMGKVTGLSPAMILLSLSVWGKLLGMLGLLIALPMTCLLTAYYRRFVLERDPEAPPALSETKASAGSG